MRRAFTIAVSLLALHVVTPIRASVRAQAASSQSVVSPTTTAKPYSFVVLGHLRGDAKGLNPKLPELFDKVRALRPDFAVATGDLIWGEVGVNPSDRKKILREWSDIDSVLKTLSIPVYRVPGNHDINDRVTRDVYRERYGTLPQVITVGDTRLLLLASVWVPSDTDTRKMPYFRTTALDSAQVEFLRSELPKTGFAHTFLFMHDLLWWQPDSTQWWREVHPMLRDAKVDVVFSGDLGPMKFSTTTRDRVRYFQSSFETKPVVEILRSLQSSRLLSSQFDNFLEVRVNGAEVDVRVHTFGEVSSEMFTPELYYSANMAPPPRPQVPAWRLFWDVIKSPKRITALVVAFIGGCAILVYAGLRLGRRRG